MVSGYIVSRNSFNNTHKTQSSKMYLVGLLSNKLKHPERLWPGLWVMRTWERELKGKELQVLRYSSLDLGCLVLSFICLLLLLLPGGYSRPSGQHWYSSPVTRPLPLGPFEGRWRWGGVWPTKQQGSAQSLFIRKLRHPLSWKQGWARLKQRWKPGGTWTCKWCSGPLQKLRTLSDDSWWCLDVWRSHTNQRFKLPRMPVACEQMSPTLHYTSWRMVTLGESFLET